jgi:aryl carrier-like protein
MSHENYLSAIQPKVDGVWNLHQQTLKSNLDFFVMMSSVHGIFGNRGQSSTAAAHTFLDAFMQYRLKQGLPAVTIDLPIIKEVGYMAENTETMELVSGIVFDSVNEAEFLSLMELAISETHSHHIITGLTVPSDQPQPFWMNDARFSHINQDNQLAKAKKSGKVASSEQALDVRAALQGVSSLDQAVSVVSLSILEKLSKLASVPLDELSKSSPLTDYGLDSISGIEMRNWIMRDLGAMIGLQDLLTASTVDALARKISEQSKLFPTFRNGI